MKEAVDTENGTTQVKTLVLSKLLELSESMLHGDYSRRMVTEFDDELITKIADNLNRFADKVQLNGIGGDSARSRPLTSSLKSSAHLQTLILNKNCRYQKTERSWMPSLPASISRGRIGTKYGFEKRIGGREKSLERSPGYR